MKDMEHISEKTLTHFKMIDEYNVMMSKPLAQQKAVFIALMGKYNYGTFDSVKQTFARLKKQYPERFNIKQPA